MAAPAHLIQLIAERGGGVAIPAGNINWDVPFPRALELARRTGANLLAALPLEPVVLGELARAQGIDPARVGLDTLFLGGAPVPPALQRRLARVWGARVIELYGSTETMLLGTSCPAGTLHPETSLAYCEVLPLEGAEAADALDSSVFFIVILPNRLLVRIETQGNGAGDPAAALRTRLAGVPVEVELVEPGMLLNVEMMSRSPHVYKPVVLSDWRRP